MIASYSMEEHFFAIILFIAERIYKCSIIVLLRVYFFFPIYIRLFSYKIGNLSARDLLSSQVKGFIGIHRLLPYLSDCVFTVLRHLAVILIRLTVFAMTTIL